MSFLRNITSGLRSLFRKEQVDRGLDEELRAYQEMATEEKMRDGMSRKDALRAVRLERGSLEVTKEVVRSGSWESLVETCWRDLRLAARMLSKSPGFTAVAVLTLALGIGANSAVFSLVDSVLLRPLPYRDASRLVWIADEMPGRDIFVVMEADYFGWRKYNHTFEDLAAYQSGDTLTLTVAGDAEQIHSGHATYNFLDVLGVTPRLGRSFNAQEDNPGAAHTVILTDSLWRGKFSADPAILGHVIDLDRVPYTVVGVLPPGFEFLDNNRADVIVPCALEHYEVAIDKPQRLVTVVGRLRPGVIPAAAAADLDGINERLWASYPPDFAQMLKGVRTKVVLVRDRVVGNVRPALLVLLGAVGFVLLITCANVANLQLARAVSREKDFAIRSALGAGSWRLMRQLLTENCLLALAGGIGGLAFASWLIGLIRLWGPKDIPHLAAAHLDLRVLLFAFALSVLTGVLFGLSPALAACRIPVIDALCASGSREGASIKARRLHSVLMVAQLAVALVLFAGAGLLIRSFVELVSIPPGFDAHGVLTAQVSLPLAVYQTQQQRVDFYRQLDQRLSALPGVESAGLATILPLEGGNWGEVTEIEGRPRTNLSEGPLTEAAEVTPGYFSSLHIPLLAGRLLDSRDASDTSRAVVVNQAFVRRFFPAEEAVGKRMRGGDRDPWLTIVGVIADSKQHGLVAAVEPEVFQALANWNAPEISLVLRTRNDSLALVPAVRSVVKELDRNLPLFNAETMESLLSRQVASQRFNAALLSGFAIFALLLAALGIYGVMAYAVGQRTHEIGVRMALGADTQSVLGMILSRGLSLAFVGLALGLVVSLLLTRFLRSLLYGIKPTDPLTFFGVTLLLIVVCFFACWLPARRAMRVDPMVALRYE